MSKDDLHSKLLKDLNEELKSKNIYLIIYTVGGFALKCHNLKEATYDIDAFYISNKEIEKAIAVVEDEEIKPYLINGEHWLNCAVDYVSDPNVVNPGEDNSTLFLTLSNLEVYIANIDYLLVMKIIAHHDRRDIELKHLADITSILRNNPQFKNKREIIRLFDKFNIDYKYYEKEINKISSN